MAFFSKKKKIADTTKSAETKKYEAVAEQIIQKSLSYSEFTDEDLQNMTENFRSLLQNGSSLEDIKIDAFAVVCAASTRVLKMTPFRVQVIGALSLNAGNVAEMRTGEGKTLTSTMPIYLHALLGEGVHVVTVNQYLAHRDAEEMGKLFTWLGLSVGLNESHTKPIIKRIAYSMDITYTTNSEIGFDYLRDNMVKRSEDKVLRNLNYAVIDECDSILIDEARTPLIISGGVKGGAELYGIAAQFVANIKSEHYDLDIESKTVALTTEGTKLAERGFKIENLYDRSHAALVHHIQNALKAQFVMQKDVDYMVAEGQIMIIDPATGRAMKGRAYSDGLHQAIQAKEKVEIKKETKTVATTTYQNFFRMYKKIGGMSGTGKTSEEEFMETYNMRVEVIPTNLPIARRDATDFIFGRQKAMHDALIVEVKELHEKGQPILIGTRSVEASEVLHERLTESGFEHEVLNAKNHERESEIIAGAGQKGKITIATNMAGRGTDIKLGNGVVEVGGLAVIGCERHESRRIDNQLIGRSGRQGDPGYSRFYISFEDELLVRFAGDKAKKQAKRLGDKQYESGLLGKVIRSAQSRIEGVNYDQRKNTVKYDDVIRQQRDIMYKQRDAALLSDDLEPTMMIMYNTIAKTAVDAFTVFHDKEATVSEDKLVKVAIQKKLIKEGQVKASEFKDKSPMDATIILRDALMEDYFNHQIIIGKEGFTKVERRILIDIIDKNWQNHIDTMTKLRTGIHLRSYAQRNPLEAYVNEGFQLFEALKVQIAHEVGYAIMSIQIKPKNSDVTKS